MVQVVARLSLTRFCIINPPNASAVKMALSPILYRMSWVMLYTTMPLQEQREINTTYPCEIKKMYGICLFMTQKTRYGAERITPRFLPSVSIRMTFTTSTTKIKR